MLETYAFTVFKTFYFVITFFCLFSGAICLLSPRFFKRIVDFAATRLADFDNQLVAQTRLLGFTSLAVSAILALRYLNV